MNFGHKRTSVLDGFLMIRSIDVRNFRCFRHLEVDGCRRLNVIVGDNGSGKTALLESIFLPLATSSEVSLRLRQQRGLDGFVMGAAKRVEEALWGDFFFNNDMSQRISLTLIGDGVESRSLEIARGSTDAVLPFLTGPTGSIGPIGPTGAAFTTQPPSIAMPVVSAPVRFTWKDSNKNLRTVTPTVSAAGVTLPDTGEDMPDFFYFAANTTIGSGENAARFSELSKSNKQEKFIKTFSREYDWIKGLNVEVHAGAPVIFASVKWAINKLPLPNISGGINRIVGFMLAIASREKSVVLVDEIENGIYYSHFPALWRATLGFLREFNAQAFVSTHSKECLNGLLKGAGRDVSDIALWRAEIGDNGERTLRQFSGDALRAGIDYGEEVR